jgi:hypothetical protein
MWPLSRSCSSVGKRATIGTRRRRICRHAAGNDLARSRARRRSVNQGCAKRATTASSATVASRSIGSAALTAAKVIYSKCARDHAIQAMRRAPATAHLQCKSLRDSGRHRTHLPVAAKMALRTADASGGNAGSPKPVTGKSVFRKRTSIFTGASAMRTIG